MRKSPILAALLVLAFASPAMAVGSVATPTVKLNPPVAPGKTVIITMPVAGNTSVATKADGSTFTPVEVVTVHGLTQTEINALPKGAASGPKVGTPAAASTLAYTSGCWTITAKDGTSALWSKMSQTWCGSTDPSRLIYYWPGAGCWGYAAWYTPNYHYIGCSTNQHYGLYWFGGNTTWDYRMCPGWFPGSNSCWSEYYGHQVWTFQANGAYGRTG